MAQGDTIVWAVACGHTTGLFHDIDSALSAVEGFPNSFWKALSCVSEAKAWLQSEERKTLSEVEKEAGSDEDNCRT